MTDFKEYVRKPFVVQAIEITAENIEELAAHIGTISEKADGTKYIQVDRLRIPNIERVYIGFYMTKMGRNIRCYSNRAFTMQFIENDDAIRTWIDYMNNTVEESNEIGAEGVST